MRITGTVLVYAEDGKWKACLNDRDGGNYAFVSGDDLQDVLRRLEDGLKKGGLDWRKNKKR